MIARERVVMPLCAGARLFGVLHEPERPCRRGALLIAGAPQYRTGSHRSFVQLARALAEAGTAVMRFDRRGMGDSEGSVATFEEAGPEIASAIDEFCTQVPVMGEIVLLGLCDGASAALLHGANDARVTGLVLVNPWARSEASAARSYLKHYYPRRLLSASLWRKVARGEFDLSSSARSLLSVLTSAYSHRVRDGGIRVQESAPDITTHESLAERLAQALARFEGRVLFVLSGADLTANEFRSIAAGSESWRRAMADERVSRVDIARADHTLTRKDWQAQAVACISQFLESW